MNLSALLLVLLGSFLHLGWNIFTKRAKDKFVFIWLAIALPALYGAYIFVQEFLFSSGNSAPDSTTLFCLLSSSIVHIFYFWTLSNSYKFADLSFVYPYCRGIGALVATLMGIAFLNESPSTLGAFGITLTIIATFIEPLFAPSSGRGVSRQGLLFTIATGLAIASYLVIDKIGVSHMNSQKYLALMFFFIFVGLAPYMLKNMRFKSELKRAKYSLLLASFFIASSYAAVLAAMAMSPVSYVVAARATGIAFSAVAGILLFKENISPYRWLSLLFISAGVICIGLA